MHISFAFSSILLIFVISQGLIAKDKFHVSYGGAALNSSLSQVISRMPIMVLRSIINNVHVAIYGLPAPLTSFPTMEKWILYIAASYTGTCCIFRELDYFKIPIIVYFLFYAPSTTLCLFLLLFVESAGAGELFALLSSEARNRYWKLLVLRVSNHSRL